MHEGRLNARNERGERSFIIKVRLRARAILSVLLLQRKNGFTKAREGWSK